MITERDHNDAKLWPRYATHCLCVLVLLICSSDRSHPTFLNGFLFSSHNSFVLRLGGQYVLPCIIDERYINLGELHEHGIALSADPLLPMHPVFEQEQEHVQPEYELQPPFSPLDASSIDNSVLNGDDPEQSGSSSSSDALLPHPVLEMTSSGLPC